MRGAYHRFLPGHNQRKPQVWVEEDRGFDTPCYIWQGNRSHGYAVDRTMRPVHRVRYAEAHGTIPIGIELHHKCGVKCCVRVDHLEPLDWYAHRAAHYGVKLTPEQAREVVASRDPADVLAERYGVSKSYISNVRNGWSMSRFTGVEKKVRNRKSHRS